MTFAIIMVRRISCLPGKVEVIYTTCVVTRVDLHWILNLGAGSVVILTFPFLYMARLLILTTNAIWLISPSSFRMSSLVTWRASSQTRRAKRS